MIVKEYCSQCTAITRQKFSSTIKADNTLIIQHSCCCCEGVDVEVLGDCSDDSDKEE